MEILLAVVILGFVVYAKGHAQDGSPTLQAAGQLTITSSNAPAVDPNSPFAGGPIGNTFLSQTQDVQHPDGSIVSLPYRPSAVYNGGGVAANFGDLIAQNSVSSVGAGISPIEMINAPHAPVAAPAGGVARVQLPTAIGGRSTLAPARIAGPATTPPGGAPIAAPRAPVAIIRTATPGRTSILSANTQGPRATANTSKVSPPAVQVQLQPTPKPIAPATPGQKKVARTIAIANRGQRVYTL